MSLAFPLVLLLQLGLIRNGLLFDLMNAAVAVWALWLFRHELRHFKALALACAFSLGLLAAGFAGAGHLLQPGPCAWHGFNRVCSAAQQTLNDVHDQIVLLLHQHDVAADPGIAVAIRRRR